jgi:hypothetical protein
LRVIPVDPAITGEEPESNIKVFSGFRVSQRDALGKAGNDSEFIVLDLIVFTTLK